MIGFLKYFWHEFKDIICCAEKWYEKIVLDIYLLAAFGGLPFFVWINLTETETVWRAVSLAGVIMMTVAWVLIITFIAIDYTDMMDNKNTLTGGNNK